MADKNDNIQWITVNGKHIPIKPGESKKDAISKAFGEDRDRFDNEDADKETYDAYMKEAAEETARVNTGQQDKVKGQDVKIESEELKDKEDDESQEEYVNRIKNDPEQQKFEKAMKDSGYELNKDEYGVKKPRFKEGSTVTIEDTLNPNNPKYQGFERSHITNAKEVDEGYTFTDANGNEVKESIIEYIPYGALQDGDNKKLYGIVRNYDGSDAPKTGAIVAHSLEDAKDQLERQVKLGIQGSDRYLGRGKYDEEYFNIIRDNREEGDDEKYKERYGWDFNKPFKEHDFMKDDPYEKWKSEREYNQRVNKILERHPEYLERYGSRENILQALKEMEGVSDKPQPSENTENKTPTYNSLTPYEKATFDRLRKRLYPDVSDEEFEAILNRRNPLAPDNTKSKEK